MSSRLYKVCIFKIIHFNSSYFLPKSFIRQASCSSKFGKIYLQSFQS